MRHTPTESSGLRMYWQVSLVKVLQEENKKILVSRKITARPTYFTQNSKLLTASSKLGQNNSNVVKLKPWGKHQ